VLSNGGLETEHGTFKSAILKVRKSDLYLEVPISRFIMSLPMMAPLAMVRTVVLLNYQIVAEDNVMLLSHPPDSTIRALSQLPEIGRYFYRYDNTELCFIPSPQVLAVVS
jgi:hypothetical protein